MYPPPLLLLYFSTCRPCDQKLISKASRVLKDLEGALTSGVIVFSTGCYDDSTMDIDDDDGMLVILFPPPHLVLPSPPLTSYCHPTPHLLLPSHPLTSYCHPHPLTSYCHPHPLTLTPQSLYCQHLVCLFLSVPTPTPSDTPATPTGLKPFPRDVPMKMDSGHVTVPDHIMIDK